VDGTGFAAERDDSLGDDSDVVSKGFKEHQGVTFEFLARGGQRAFDLRFGDLGSSIWIKDLRSIDLRSSIWICN
jgi:hypothetical protein